MRHVARLGVSSSKALGRAFRGGASGPRPTMAQGKYPKRITCEEDGLVAFKNIFAGLDPRLEHFVVLSVDSGHRVLGHDVVATGPIGLLPVHPCAVFRAALVRGAHAIFVAHNHPSGNLKHSIEDWRLKRILNKASALLKMPIYQHYILETDGPQKRIKSWTEAEVEKLASLANAHTPVRKISRQLGRPTDEIIPKLHQLGIQPPSQKRYR